MSHTPIADCSADPLKVKAAAPDLLLALITCYNLFEAEYEDLSDQGKRARKQAQEAIKKAME